MNSEEVPEHPLEQFKRELDERLPQVTPEAISKVMQRFPLSLADGWDFARLATVVRRVLACEPRPERLLKKGHRNSPYFLERQALKASAKKASDTAQTLKGIEMVSRGRIMGLGLLLGNKENRKINTIPAMQRYNDIVKELEWLTSFLGELASGISKPPPRWEDAVDRDWRIRMGWALAAVYRAAFAQEPKAHTSESGETLFMQFFRHMIAMAFSELTDGGRDFKAVSMDACKMHRAKPAEVHWLSKS